MLKMAKNVQKKGVLHKFLAFLSKNEIFFHLTLKLTFWPWIWPQIIKITSKMDNTVKITCNWGITLVPSFICWKIIFDLVIDLWPWIKKMPDYFKLALIGFEFSRKKSIRNIKKTLYMQQNKVRLSLKRLFKKMNNPPISSKWPKMYRLAAILDSIFWFFATASHVTNMAFLDLQTS